MIYYKTFIILKGILRTEDIEVWNWCQTQRNDDYWYFKCDSIKVEVWDDFEGTPDEPMKLTGTIETEYEWFEFFRDYEKRKNKEKHQI